MPGFRERSFQRRRLGVTPSEAVADAPSSEAVNVAVWLLVTVPAVATKVPLEEFAATVSEAGTLTAELFEDKVTGEPPPGAAPESVTVHVEVARDSILAGVHRSVKTITGATLSEAVADIPPSEAVNVAVCSLVTALAVALKAAVNEFAATVTEAGTVTAVMFEESATAEPPAGAAAETVTVQVEVARDAIAAGAHRRVDMATGATVSVAVAEVPPSDAVSTDFCVLDTAAAVAVNVAPEEFAAIVTEAGTETAGLPEDRATVQPPAGAAAETRIVQVEIARDARLAGEHCSADNTTEGDNVSGVDADVPFSDAVSTATWLVRTATLDTVKPAAADPAATATDAGIVSAGLLFDRLTVTPPAGAGSLSVTVHSVLAGVVIEGVLHSTVFTPGAPT